MTLPASPSSRCPRCKQLFECRAGAIESCHCASVHLTEDLRRTITTRWQGCLCHQCLLELRDNPHQHSTH